jgi:hypothetical protein
VTKTLPAAFSMRSALYRFLEPVETYSENHAGQKRRRLAGQTASDRAIRRLAPEQGENRRQPSRLACKGRRWRRRGCRKAEA